MRISVWRKLLLLFLFIGFLNLFLFHTFGQTALALVFAAFYLFFTGIFFNPKNPGQRLPVFLIGGFLTFVLLLLVNRSQGFVLFVLILASLTTLIFYLYLLVTRITFVRSFLELLFIPILLGLSYLKAGLRILQYLVNQKYVHKSSRFDSSRVKSLVLGLVIGLPVVFALVVLLSGADPIYAKFIGSILRFDWFRIPVTWQDRFLFSLFWLVFLSPLLLLVRKSEFRSPLSSLARVTFTREMTIVMLLVAIILGSFLGIQAPYVFVNVPFETDLSRFGVATYSEYVKRGFLELLFVSAFIYSLVWLGHIFLRGKTKTEQDSLRYVQLLVLAEFAVFIISIFRRIYLYQLHHGWSLVRIYGGLFVVWLTFFTVTLALRHFYAKRWIFAEVGLTAAMILFVGIFNAESFIATTHPPTVNKRTDYVYLSRMSADGYEGWKKAFAYAQDVLINRQLLQKDIINRGDRREVAYAGMIVNHLSATYLDLAYKHATLEEWQEYQKAIYDYLFRLTDTEHAKFISQGIDPVDLTLDTIKFTKEQIQQKLTLLENETVKKTDLYINENRYPFPFTGPAFDGCGGAQMSFCFRSWFGFDSPNPGKSKRNYDTLDSLFTWNASQAQSYQIMKLEITYTDLILLQHNYFDLYNKIIRQPPEERGYDVDISFNTPFL